MQRATVDYHLNHITGSCWLMASPHAYDAPGCTANHHFIDYSKPGTLSPRSPDTCSQMLRFLKQGDKLEVTSAVDEGWHRWFSVRTSDGVEGWVDSIFVRIFDDEG